MAFAGSSWLVHAHASLNQNNVNPIPITAHFELCAQGTHLGLASRNHEGARGVAGHVKKGSTAC